MSTPDYPVVKPGAGESAGWRATSLRRLQLRRGRFELTGEPLKVGICHCMECRKATGAIYVTYADWPRSAFELLGEAREYRGRSFCPTCGSRVFHLSEGWVESWSARSMTRRVTSARRAKAGSSGARSGSRQLVLRGSLRRIRPDF